jgi:hypothetical protein
MVRLMVRRQTGDGWVGGGGAEVNEKEDVLRRRSPTIKTMEQRPMCRRKLTDEGTEEEAGSPILPCCGIGGPMQFPKKGVSDNISSMFLLLQQLVVFNGTCCFSLRSQYSPRPTFFSRNKWPESSCHACK